MNITSLGPNSSGCSQTAPSVETAKQVRQAATAVRALNESGLLPQDQEMTLSIDPATKMAVVKIIDSRTHDVLQQLPADYVLRVAAYLQSETSKVNPTLNLIL